MPLTAEQLKNIEEKRKIALEKKKAAESRAAVASTSNIPTTASNQRPSSTITSNSFYNKYPSSSSSGNAACNVKKPLTFVKSTSATGTAPKTTISNGFGPNAKKLKTSSSTTSTSSLSTYVNSIAFGQTNTLTGICKMISKDRFAVEAGYQQQMIDLFKTIPSRLYDMKSRTWSFSINDHDSLVKELKKNESVSITGVPQQIRALFKKKSLQKKEEIDLSCIDKKVLDALMPFQEEGVRFCIEHGGRAMIADDMGLGKTVQAVAVAYYYKDDWPLLIVCPSSVRFTWADAIKTWLPSVPQYQVAVMTTGKDFVEDAKIVIISYDLLSRVGKELEKMKFNIVILDESHSLKNFKTNRSKAAQPFAKKARRVILLSGTPALSRPIELYVQLSIINQTGMLSYHDFGVRYCNAQLKQWGWDFNGSVNMDELNLLLQECFMIRRLKKDVLTQLPAKFRQVVVLPPSAVSIKSKELKQAAQGMQRSNLHGSEKQGALLVYFNATAAAKLKGICDYVLDMVKDEKKFLCFAHHKIVMDSICDKLQSANYRFIRIDGSTDSQSRQEYCKQFQEDNRVKVAVLSITAANTGLTLTAAHLVLFAELYWNPGVLLQAEDRAHRIGQLDSVVVQYLIAQGTADDHLWNLLEKKLAVLNKAGLNADNLTATASAATKRLEDKAQPSITEFMSRNDEEVDAEDQLLASMDLDALICNIPDA